MLNDHFRNTLYEAAIAEAIATFKQIHGRSPRVLDIGALPCPEQCDAPVVLEGACALIPTTLTR